MSGAATNAGGSPPALTGQSLAGKGQKVRAMLRARLGEDVFANWFTALEFESFDGRLVKTSVPVKFLRNWIQSHYADELLACCKTEFPGAERVDVGLRQLGGPLRSAVALTAGDSAKAAAPAPALKAAEPAEKKGQKAPEPTAKPAARTAAASPGRTPSTGFEGSPLDPRYTFNSFAVGAPNRMAHAAAMQVTETVLSGTPVFNPLYLHASVGLGKTHLLHAAAWEVKRRNPAANILYLTAERFRYQFVEAVRNQDPFVFKDKFRGIDMLLIDDLEFLQGERTEQEFEHIINSFLDGGKQVAVASARAPGQIERLNGRMRSRLHRGLVVEIGRHDEALRVKILEKRLAEKRVTDPSFELSQETLEFLAARLTESGRELEGAITRLHAMWQYMRTPITPDAVETVVRDIVQGAEPRRIRVEDILRIVSRHFGISKGDLLSERRHRSVVRPRQIGMYLAKQLTSRSLPEIGRRFGNRDHTTVLHAVRKIESELAANARLRSEIEELRKILTH